MTMSPHNKGKNYRKQREERDYRIWRGTATEEEKEQQKREGVKGPFDPSYAPMQYKKQARKSTEEEPAYAKKMKSDYERTRSISKIRAAFRGKR